MAKGGGLKRTKLFFGARCVGCQPPAHQPSCEAAWGRSHTTVPACLPAFAWQHRYLWTRDQLGEPEARIAGGVRVDVPQARFGALGEHTVTAGGIIGAIIVVALGTFLAKRKPETAA